MLLNLLNFKIKADGNIFKNYLLKIQRTEILWELIYVVYYLDIS